MSNSHDNAPMSDTLDVFHIMSTMRAMRRLKPDPVPPQLIKKILDAGTWAPNSLNSQPYRFIVVTARDSLAFFGERYDAAMRERFAPLVPADDDRSARARNIRTAMAMGAEIKNFPLLLVICGVRDWPFSVPAEQRVGLAPPSPGSVYPCVQNMLLACRALGLGASLTTMHQVFEAELCEHLAIPDSHGIVAVLPVGYPKGNFGPVGRRPSAEITFAGRWGRAIDYT